MTEIVDFFGPDDWVIDHTDQFDFSAGYMCDSGAYGQSALATKPLVFDIPTEGRNRLSNLTIKTSVEKPSKSYTDNGEPPMTRLVGEYKNGSALYLVLHFNDGIEITIEPLIPRDSVGGPYSGRVSVKSSEGVTTYSNIQFQDHDWVYEWSLSVDTSYIVFNGTRLNTGVGIENINSASVVRRENAEETLILPGTIPVSFDTVSPTCLQVISYEYQHFEYVGEAIDAAWPVADIIRDISERAGVTEDLLNMTDIFGDKYPVYGCFATPDDDAYTLIEELQKLHMFDTCNFDGRLNFIKRGGDVAADIPIDDLVDNSREIEKRERKDAIEVPRALNLEYYDIDGDLAPNKQISDRSLDIRAKDEEKQETAVILSADQAAQMATITHKVMIEEQGGGYEFSLPDSYSWLTTGDVIRLDGLRLRIIEVEIDEGLQNYKTVLDRASAYTSSISGVPPSDPVEPEDETSGETVFEFLDIPILSDADDRLLFYSAVNGYDNWRGAGVDLSLDGGANYIDSDSSETPSTIGYLETDLQAGSVYYPDSVNSVRVRLIRDDLEIESATLAEMQNRKNLCAIGNELVNFGNVTEIEPGLWELDYLLRGRKGTASEFHPAGERLVMLRRPVLATVPAETYLLNQELTFRATSVGNDAPSAIKAYLYEGVSQRERMPSYLRAVKDSGNIIISWQGVGRIGAGANVSQSQHWRGYRVYINGFAQPDQASTGLTVSDPGGSVTIEVCQLNQFTGEGPKASIEI